MAASNEIAVGIDLGTSYSCVAIAERGVPRVIADTAGDRVHASVVTFLPDGKLVVGNAARRLIPTHPSRTVASAKRLMGRFFFSDEVKKAQRRHGFKIVEGPSSSVRIQIDDALLTPQEIGGLVLRRMKMIAEEALGRPVSKAVLTCPAYFNDNQRQATRDAGELAGLEVLRIINEPTAAALAYGYGRDLVQRVAIYDLGGGTFDVSILEIGRDTYEVLSTAGDTYLGGDDIDERIIDFVANAHYQSAGVDLREDAQVRPRLLDAAELAKRALSKLESHVLKLDDVGAGNGGKSGKNLEVTITRADLGRMSMDLLQRTFKVCDEALQAARLVPADLAGVILVGGPTRLPFIRNAVAHYFGQSPKDDVDPDEVVALGAALQAAGLVSAGPATMLLDVTPLTLRLATVGGYTEEIIPKNTPIPIERSRTFTTARDDQERVQVIVLQGEDRLQKNCELLAHFEFSGLRKAARGQVKIQVTFEIDANGIVNVSAKDIESGRAAKTQITLSSGMSKADLDAGKARAQGAEIVAVTS